MCENCYTSHMTFRAMKDHKIIKMEDILTGRVNLTKEEENRYCKVHGKLCEYYCETEKKSLCRDCVILNECPPEHSRVSLKKASQIHSDELKDLLEKSSAALKKYEEAVVTTNRVRKELEIHSQLGKEILKKAEKDYTDKVKETFKKFEAEVDSIQVKRMAELDQNEVDLKSTMKKIKSITEHTEKIIKTESEFEIVSSHSNLSTQLQQFSQFQPVATDQKLGYIKFQASIPKNSTMGHLIKYGMPGGRWKLTSQFNTGEFNTLCGLALDEDDKVVLCSWEKGAGVFSRAGELKCTIYNYPGAVDVVVSPDNKYHSIPIGKQLIMTNNRNGRKLSTTHIKDVNNISSDANSLAVDSSGKMIVGQVSNTISIHNTDGSLISKFATQSRPYRLAATSNGEIVSSFMDSDNKSGKSVQLMDYSGGNVRVIQPPTEVKVWKPGCVCCRQGEIFVANAGTGDPCGVYRYTSEGDYLGCVTTTVANPTGISMLQDGMELFVANFGDSHVKIFQRP